MTRNELAKELQIKESYLFKRWRDIVASKARMGIELYKCGYGDTAEYGIKYPWEDKARFEYVDGITLIRGALDELGVEFEENYVVDNLTFDFYISDAEVIIEWCGRSAMKKQWCELNGVQYVNIAATDEITAESMEEKIYG